MTPDQIKTLLNRYKDGIATEQDKAFLETWYMEHEGAAHTYSPEEHIADANAIWDQLQETEPVIRPLRSWLRVAAAASVILCLSVGGYFILHKQDGPQLSAHNTKNDIRPAGSKAVLKLPGGKDILLSGIKNSTLTQQQAVIHIANGELIYQNKNAVNSQSIVYDTLVTPRGGHFQLTLSDGSKVWLNAASAIRYPETFAGNERTIELIKGEAYFEVVHNDQQPFKVITHNQVVEDIGTHFNVSAYDDETDVETTLLEGSVSVSKSGRRVVLKPGQQSSVASGDKAIVIKDADMDKAVAWKNNYFVFNGERIESIMRQISRWYDVDVSYEGDMNGKEFVGSVSRSQNVLEVLRKLEKTGTIHFRVEGRKIIVTP
jgi:transmembrane sensor